ncbi:MAG: ATP-binding protein, partial [Desulfobacterales bacterium]|nr:ATP-binding protein [Desulfobacterales bacterium]
MAKSEAPQKIASSKLSTRKLTLLNRELDELKKTLEIKGRELQIMLDSAPAMIFFKDTHRRYVRVNKKFAETLGLPISQVIGRKLADLCPENQGLVPDDDRAVIQSGQPVLNKRGYLDTPTGRKPVLIDQIPYLDADGQFLGIIGFVQDLSALEKAEQEKKELREKIIRTEKLESLGRLAGGIAHDFNNLLFAIQANVDLIELKTDTVDGPRALLRRIEELIESGVDLTQQLLGFAREGKREIRATNLNELAAKIAAIFSHTQKGIEIHQDFQEDLWTVAADRSQIEQVLMNLCLNAVQAMPAGGDLFLQTANASLKPKFVKAHAISPGRYVALSVTDTGIGMDEETRKRVFEPFFTTKEMGHGTGLGLASAYGIVQNHREIIQVESQKGQRTTFKVYLPVAAQKALEKTQPEPELMGGTETILLVDDERAILDIATEVLGEIGYAVIPAEGGREAVRRFRQRPDAIDLVILDMGMPG